MQIVSVSASGAYDVVIGSGLLAEAGSRIRAVSGAARALVAADDTVAAHYGGAVLDSLRRAGIRASLFSFAAGKARKRRRHIFLSYTPRRAVN